MPTNKKYYKKARKTARKQKHRSSKIVAYGKIYANWCGHCKAMEHDWKRLEKKMRHLKCVNIESEEKDHKIPAFNKKHKTNLALQNGFPTIFKLKKVGGQVEYYSGGERTESALSAWLSSSSEKGGSNEHQNQNPEGQHPDQDQKQKQEPSFFGNLF